MPSFIMQQIYMTLHELVNRFQHVTHHATAFPVTRLSFHPTGLK